MARYKFTPGRRAALQRAQFASARKRALTASRKKAQSVGYPLKRHDEDFNQVWDGEHGKRVIRSIKRTSRKTRVKKFIKRVRNG